MVKPEFGFCTFFSKQDEEAISARCWNFQGTPESRAIRAGRPGRSVNSVCDGRGNKQWACSISRGKKGSTNAPLSRDSESVKQRFSRVHGISQQIASSEEGFDQSRVGIQDSLKRIKDE